MANYADYKNYHTVLKNSDFSMLKGIASESGIGYSMKKYSDLNSKINSLGWQGDVYSSASKKMDNITQSLIALQNETANNLNLLVSSCEELLKTLTEMENQQNAYDECSKTVDNLYEVAKKARATLKGVSNTDETYLEKSRAFYRAEDRYNDAVGARNDVQNKIDILVKVADMLINRLKNMQFEANIVGILNETAVVQSSGKTVVINPEYTEEQLKYTIYVPVNLEELDAKEIGKLVENLEGSLKRDQDFLNNYMKYLNSKIQYANSVLVSGNIAKGTPEYEQAYSYWQTLIKLNDKAKTAYDQRVQLQTAITNDNYYGNLGTAWNRGEFRSAVVDNDKTKVAEFVNNYNNETKSMIPMSDFVTEEYRMQHIYDYREGEYNPLLVSTSSNQSIKCTNESLIQLPMQEVYINAAQQGRITNIDSNIQQFSTTNNDNIIYTYEYNIQTNTYSLYSIDSDGQVQYFDGSSG